MHSIATNGWTARILNGDVSKEATVTSTYALLRLPAALEMAWQYKPFFEWQDPQRSITERA